jgi:TPR repeat protein
MAALTRITLVFIALLFAAPVSAADYQNYKKGTAAYKSGDYATALREWKPLAEQGDASAQQKMGWIYAHGRGVPKDYKTAVKWFRLAAKQGDASTIIRID